MGWLTQPDAGKCRRFLNDPGQGLHLLTNGPDSLILSDCLPSVLVSCLLVSEPVLLNEPPAHKLILNVRVVNRCRDETGDAESGLHDEHREQ